MATAPLVEPSVGSGLEARIAGLARRQAHVDKGLASRQAPVPKLAVNDATGPALITLPVSDAQPKASIDDHLSTASWELISLLQAEISPEQRAVFSRSQIAKITGTAVDAYLIRHAMNLGKFTRRDLVTNVMQALLTPLADRVASSRPRTQLRAVEVAKAAIQPLILEHMDVATAVNLPRATFEAQLVSWVRELLADNKIQLNFTEQCALIEELIADMLGLGPLEPLLTDETVSDIMVNGPKHVYVERRGKLELTDATFRDEPHLMNICNKIVTRIGRRIDELHPLVDARLPDGSRVNIIIAPLALDGAMITIRKFSKKTITLDVMVAKGSISPAMATVLKVAARCRVNILISGGTGSGKTTLLNALSQLIDVAERTVTIEDAAELQLQQPHVGRLETRPANLEGSGEVTIRDLLRNVLRMRPDRIIIGECRGEEAFDMLQAMNTGHDGSMSTIHANTPTRRAGPPRKHDQHGRCQPAVAGNPHSDRLGDPADLPGQSYA